MDELRKAFEEAFKIPFSTLVLPRVRLLPVESSNLLYGSEPAVVHPMRLQGEVLSFDKAAPEGYVLVGFWGHGINSYAFYYQRADGWSRVSFRLPYGGAYMDNEDYARRIAEFLPEWFEFEKRLGRQYRLTALDAIGEGRYELVHPDGRLVTAEGSLLGKRGFAKSLGLGGA